MVKSINQSINQSINNDISECGFAHITAHRLALKYGNVHPTNAKSHHSADVGKRPKAERGLSKLGSEAISSKECGVILRMSGKFILTQFCSNTTE